MGIRKGEGRESAARGAWRPDAPGEAVFSLGRGGAPRSLVPFLRAEATLRALPRESHTLVYYDTFDWRLHRAGLRLTSHEENGLTALWLQRSASPGEPGDASRSRARSGSAKGGAGRGRPAFARVAKLPSFASDLPEGRLRRRLERITDVRRLHPVVRIDLSRRGYRVLDDEQKTVVKLVFERAVARDPAVPGIAAELGGTLRVVPVAGYRKAHAATLRRLGERPGIAPIGADLASRALAAIGREVVAHRSELRSELDARSPAGAAFLSLHRELFATMRDNVRGIREDLDPEHVHDFRVAVRRTRSLYRLYRDLIAGTAFEALLPGFKWLGRVTNPTRDLDVHLIELREQLAKRPEERDALLPLEALLREKRRVEWERLVEALDSSTWAELEAAAAELLDPPSGPEADRVAASGPPLGPWASDRIVRALRRVARHGRRISDDSPGEKLHELRLDAKRLRYLLEFFRSLHPAEEIDPLLKSIKRLQQNLGRFNDARVQSRSLRELGRELAAQGSHGDALLAVGRLVERAERRRERERARFHERFRRFDSRTQRERFRRVFAAGERPAATPSEAARDPAAGPTRPAEGAPQRGERA